MSKNLCIIPARGGSKRIPRKNIKNFLGKPIIAYSIETALSSKIFDEVMVSTDDKEIAEIARKYGAKVPFMRSKNNSDDFATMADVIEEVKNGYIENGRSFSYICCILPTAPLMTVGMIRKGFNLLLEKKVDSVVPIIRFSYPIQRALKVRDDQVEMFYPEHMNTRSQDLEPAFYDAGQFYWMKFLNSKMNIKSRMNRRHGFEISELEAQDIDTLEDWKVAELKYERINNKRNIKE